MGISKYTVRIIGAFIFGILAQHFFSWNGFLILSLWLCSFVLFLCFLLQFGTKFRFQSIIGFQILLIFFLTGSTAKVFRTPGALSENYQKTYIRGDEVIAEIREQSKGKGGYNKCILSVLQLKSNDQIRKSHGHVLAYIKENSKELRVGQTILFKPSFVSIKNKNNPGEFDTEFYWKNKGITEQVFISEAQFLVLGDSITEISLIERIRRQLSKTINSKLSKEVAAVALALSIGDKSYLSSETRAQFANAGAMHVLAVSGLHVGILLAILQWLFYQIKILRKRNQYVIIAICILWFFAFLTGLSPSVLRATLMFSILGFGQLLGRPFFNLNAILVSALLILMLNANYLFDIGFQLSFLAMLGITFFNKPLSSAFVFNNKWVNNVWKGTTLGIAAQIGTLPISLYYFHQFPNYFILTNIGMMVFAGLALGSIIVFLLFSFVPYLEILLTQIVEQIIRLMLSFIKWIDQLPQSVTTGFSINTIEIVALYLLTSILIIGLYKRKLKLLQITLFLTVIICSLLVSDQIKNSSKRELVVFNSSSPLILIKNGKQNHCIYLTEDKKEISRHEFMVKAYEKVNGGKTTFHLLDINAAMSIQLDDDWLQLEHFKSQLNFSFKNKNHLIPLLDDFIVHENHQIIVGEWLKNSSNLSKKLNALNLNEGALIMN